MIPVTVKDLVMTNVGFAVILKGEDDARSLPIFIGAPEAQAISIELAHEKPPRPLTHDLLRVLLEELDVQLEKVEIFDLREGTFHARLILRRGIETLRIDARPSDGIALALRTGASLYVTQNIMEEAGKIIEPELADDSGRSKSKTSARSSTEKILAVRKHALDKAIDEERYEDAARLRDEIKRLENEIDPQQS